MGANWHSSLRFSMRLPISAAVLGFSFLVSKGNIVWGISLFLDDSLISFPSDPVSSVETCRMHWGLRILAEGWGHG